ncbi:hypothetical protein KM043_005923 [Ampulex compressa]|nr:hypothetical protein KM043_005923 [Ampulex compressa]
MKFPPESTTYNTACFDDLEYSIQINRWLLKPLGAWPSSETTSRTERILSKLLTLTCHSLIAFTVVPSMLHIILEKEDIYSKLQAIGPTSHWLTGGVNYCSLLSRSKKIRRCVEHMEMDWRSVKRAEDREVMLRNARFGRLIAGFSAIFMHIGVFSYSIITGMTSIVAVVDNETIVMQRLPCPAYDKFIDTRFSPANEIVLGLQFLSCFIVNSISVGVCGMAAAFAMHACGQLNVVMLWLDDFVDGKEKKSRSVQRRLASIVQLHLRTLRYYVQCLTKSLIFLGA